MFFICSSLIMEYNSTQPVTRSGALIRSTLQYDMVQQKFCTRKLTQTKNMKKN